MDAAATTSTGLLLTPDTSQFFASFAPWPPSGSPAAHVAAKPADAAGAGDREAIRARFSQLFTPTTPMQTMPSPSLFESPSTFFAAAPHPAPHPAHPPHPSLRDMDPHMLPVPNRSPLLPLQLPNAHFPPPHLYPAAVIPQPALPKPPESTLLARYPPVRAFVHRPRSAQDKLDTEAASSLRGAAPDLADIDPNDKQALARCLSRKTREAALARYRQKRKGRKGAGSVRYDCRKRLADSRPRIKGRFAKSLTPSDEGQQDASDDIKVEDEQQSSAQSDP